LPRLGRELSELVEELPVVLRHHGPLVDDGLCQALPLGGDTVGEFGALYEHALQALGRVLLRSLK
jgi:hypothetical protein